MHLMLLLGAADPEWVPTFTVEQTPTWLRIRSATPGTFVVIARAGPEPGDLQLAVDKDDDGILEFESRLGASYNRGLASSKRNACHVPGFVPEFETIRLVPLPPEDIWSHERRRRRWMEVDPTVLFEHYDDGNVHIVLDTNRDGVPEAEATTDFVLDTPRRTSFCLEHLPKRPSVPRPP